MLRYWFGVLYRALLASFDAIGQSQGTLLFAMLGIAIGGGLVWYRRGAEVMKANLLQTALEVVAVAALAWLPFFLWHLFQTPYLQELETKQKQEEASHKLTEAKAELERRRPYVLIEPLPAEEIRVMASKDPNPPARPDAVYGSGYVVGKSVNSTGELLFFGVTNVGEVPARKFRYHFAVRKSDSTGVARDVPLRPVSTNAEVMFKDRPVSRRLLLPDGTVFTGTEGANQGAVRVVIVVTYSGAASDANTYFFKIILQINRSGTPDDVNRNLGAFRTILTDEGVLVGDVSQLLQ